MRRLSISIGMLVGLCGLAAALAGCVPAAIPQARLGDRVWNDHNGDGIQDEGEPGKEGVEVSLHGEDGSLIAADLTDELGFYAFDQLHSGRYFLRYVVPEGWTITKLDVGDDELDSDADPQSGQTEVFSFDSHTSDLSRDIGLLAAESQASGTAIAELVPTVEATNTPQPLLEYQQDEALQASHIVILSTDAAESGVLNANGSSLSSDLPEQAQVEDRLLVLFVDPEGNISVGWIGDTEQASLNATGYRPGSTYPNWEFTRTLNPSGAAPGYEPEQVGVGDPGTCFGSRIALALSGISLEQLQILGQVSFWSYRANPDGSNSYAHRLLDAAEFEAALAFLAGEGTLLSTPGGPVLVGLPGSEVFDPSRILESPELHAALEEHLGGPESGDWQEFGECLQQMAYAQ